MIGAQSLRQETLRSVAPLIILALIWAPFAIGSHWFGVVESRVWFSMISIASTFAYAWFRAHRTNPATNGAYGHWLRQTPWAWGRPLPLGWARLSVADGLVVLGFAALFPFGFVPGLVVGSTAYGCGYLVGQLLNASTHDEPILQIGVFFIAGLGIAFSAGPNGPAPLSLYLALAAAVALSQFTLPRVLNRFHQLTLETNLTLAERKERSRGRKTGSPWQELLEDIEAQKASPIKLTHWLVPSLLCVWLFGCCEFARARLYRWADSIEFESLASETSLWGGFRTVCYVACRPDGLGESSLGVDAYSVSLTLGAFALAAAVAFVLLRRITIYWPPINPLGRIATGRLIIPDYDYVFLGPIAAVLTYALVGLALSFLPGLGLLMGGVALASALLVLARLTPDYEAWRLTGHHRIVCANGAAKS